MTSWMQLLTQHSVDDLLAMARQQKAGAEERARDLGEVIVTLEQLASSESLLQRLTIPGPRPPGVDTSPVPAAERRQADETVLQPPHAPDPAGQRALALAVRAPREPSADRGGGHRLHRLRNLGPPRSWARPAPGRHVHHDPVGRYLGPLHRHVEPIEQHIIDLHGGPQPC